ncbi:MAG: PAS domain S-box protein [Myxococcales bacterium]|nr:PAS domain S-box protein [Myxococcales bacterium]
MERYKDPLQPLDAVAWTADAITLRFTYVSPRAHNMLGYPLDQWLSETNFWARHQPDEDRGRTLAILKAVAADREGRRCEHRFIAADGRHLWFRTTVQGFPSGGPVRELGGLMVDITEQKHAEAALREVTERLRTVVDHAPLVMFAVNRDGVFTLSEGRGLSALGLRAGEVVGRSAFDAYRDYPWVVAAIRRALRGDEFTSSGEVAGIFYETQYVPLRDEKGQVIGSIGIATDFTERRRAEQALEKERDFTAAVIDVAGALVVVLDRSGRIVRYNHGCERCTGYTFDEVAGRMVWDLFLLPEEIEPGKREFAGLLGGSFPHSFENYWLAKDGTRRLIAWANTALVDEFGGVEYVIGTGIDITARQQAEEERARLLMEEQRARAAAEDAQRRAAFLSEASRVLAASLDYQVTLRNVAQLAAPHFADWCVIDLVDEDGALRRVAVGHHDPEKAELASALQRVSRIDPDAVEGVPRVIRTGLPTVVEGLSDATIADGDARPLGTPDLDQPGVIPQLGVRSYMSVPLLARGRVIGALTFVASQVGWRFQGADLAMAEELGHRAAIAIDNARLHRETEEAVRTRNEFLSIASHELKTPLTSLQLAVQAMLRVARGGSLASVPLELAKSILETTERQGKRLEKLVNNLLDVSRISAGRLDLQIDDVDLSAVARDVVAGMHGDLAVAGCEVDLRAQPGVIGRWDRVRVEQVVTNLLSNAIKYGAGRPIAITVSASGGTALLVVEDRGIGIPADRVAGIFNRYERAVSSRHYGGLGLGLYIVRRILDALGGKVEVTTQLGVGSVFAVTLPGVLDGCDPR